MHIVVASSNVAFVPGRIALNGDWIGNVLTSNNPVLISCGDTNGPIREQFEELPAGVELERGHLVDPARYAGIGQAGNLIGRDTVCTSKQVQRNAAVDIRGSAGAALRNSTLARP